MVAPINVVLCSFFSPLFFLSFFFFPCLLYGFIDSFFDIVFFVFDC